MRRLLALLAALFLAPAAHGAIIAVTFGGNITSVGTGLESGFTVGDPFTGSFQIDTTAPDKIPDDPMHGSYDAISNLSVNFGGYVATATSGEVQISNDQGTPPSDFFHADAFSFHPGSLTGASVAGHNLNTFFLDLGDSDGSTFSSKAIPTSLSLSSFSAVAQSSLDFDQAGSGSLIGVSGTVTSLTYAVVPEPNMLALLALGVAGLALRRRP